MCIQARDGWIWTMIWMNMVFPQICCKSKDPRNIGWYGYWPMVANSLRNLQAMSHLLEFNAGFCRGEYRDAAEPAQVLSFDRPHQAPFRMAFCRHSASIELILKAGILLLIWAMIFDMVGSNDSNYMFWISLQASRYASNTQCPVQRYTEDTGSNLSHLQCFSWLAGWATKYQSHYPWWYSWMIDVFFPH